MNQNKYKMLFDKMGVTILNHPKLNKWVSIRTANSIKETTVINQYAFKQTIINHIDILDPVWQIVVSYDWKYFWFEYRG